MCGPIDNEAFGPRIDSQNLDEKRFPKKRLAIEKPADLYVVLESAFHSLAAEIPPRRCQLSLAIGHVRWTLLNVILAFGVTLHKRLRLLEQEQKQNQLAVVPKRVMLDVEKSEGRYDVDAEDSREKV